LVRNSETVSGFGTEGVFVTIPHGSSSRAAARILEKNGVIRSALAFEFYARRHSRRSLQAGDTSSITQLRQGHFFGSWRRRGYVLPFTVREGETMFDIAHELEAAKFIPAADFLRAAKDTSGIKDLAPYAKTLKDSCSLPPINLPRHPSHGIDSEMVQKFREQWRAISASDPAPASRGGRRFATITPRRSSSGKTPKAG